MRLTSIKLAGFKSFVDPTTLHLPTNMTGIVGPNGCGKSNIIDAVRWVMGESTAGRLRGDSLADVIFSGSSSRKPVSQAVVELLFDNSDQAIGGEYARYNEISVKRMVARDGQSVYYLNGTRCRRRDITDLFLGTGLGPRSYSIIEQGMISQVIDARPEDLRLFLEEAAGISRYKERRKETESRIQATRDNLDRLGDLRREIEKQLEHLKRQARAAEQYQALQAEHREKDAQLKALEYRRLQNESLALAASLQQVEAGLQVLDDEQRTAEIQGEQIRGQHALASEQLGRAQAEHYRVGGELARVEQQIQHQRELKRRLESSRSEAETSLQQLRQHLESDALQLQTLVELLAESEPRLESLRHNDRRHQEALAQAETALVESQQQRDAIARSFAEATRTAEVEGTRIELLQRQAIESRRRREALLAEQSGLDIAELAAGLEALTLEQEGRRATLEPLAEMVETRKAAVLELTSRQQQRQTELAELRKSMQSARGRMASLEALQQAALGQEKNAATLDWLRARGLDGLPRLGEVLEVEPGWETAVEVALGSLLEAVVVADPLHWRDDLAALAQGRVALIAAGQGGQAPPAGSLAAKVKGPAAILALLAGTQAIEEGGDPAEAGQGSEQSLIDRRGLWQGPGWLRYTASGEAQQGMLVREREIHELRTQITRFSAREQEALREQELLRQAQSQAEQALEEARRSLQLAQRMVSELVGRIQGMGGRLDAARARLALLEHDLAQIAESMERSGIELQDSQSRRQAALQQLALLEQRRAALEAQRDSGLAARDLAKSKASEAKEAAHQLALTCEAQRAQVLAIEHSLQRQHNQRDALATRCAEFLAQLQQCDAPIQALEIERQGLLEQRLLAEQELARARGALEEIDQQLRRSEHARQQRDQALTTQRDRLTSLRLQAQALDLRALQLAEAILALGLEPAAVVAGLPSDAEPEGWAQTVLTIEARLRRLEPVNLAAIREHAEQSERKQWLDDQHLDLSTALEQLEDAIRKIDRETRGRFKETFDRVNAGVQELFPRLFGGGHAYLELTGEDLLDTGVAILARPPGKRIANISLLSGGEKALTAVALVFAIFRLNPAPFCLLDEVDAPLDEANVGRFCSMVEEMSEQVQFLIVSHNKTTMEAVRQLAGVTMREPGVSRLVSVDLAEATRLAGAA